MNKLLLAAAALCAAAPVCPVSAYPDKPDEVVQKTPTRVFAAFSEKVAVRSVSWKGEAWPLDFADKVAYAQLLNDKSEVALKWGQIFLPVDKPPVEIPVVEFILK